VHRFQRCHRLPTTPSPPRGYIPPEEGASLSIVLEHLTKTYAGQTVVRDVSLEIGDGELCVFLGPSGSGKSTILRIVAGLTDSDSGRVLLHGRDVTRIPPQKRGVGFVFQHYALFRHMTVADNVEFALRVRGVAPRERAQRRDDLLEMVGLSGYGLRRPDQLSGGQQQRVALARALAHRPEVLLLDEPFGALDARIRAGIRATVRRIQRELGVTTIFVTHDQEEAFELADRIAVLNHGRLLERGTPRELYLHPSTEFTATFLGTANLVVAERSRRGLRVGDVDLAVGTPSAFTIAAPDGLSASAAPGGGAAVAVAPAMAPVAVAAPGEATRVQLLFRPEDIAIKDSPDALQWPLLGEGVVEESTFVGAFERLRLRLPIKGVRVLAPPAPFGSEYVVVEAVRSQHLAHRYPLRPGDRTWVGLRRVHALAHPGMAFLIVDDGSGAAAAAIALGGRIARLARSRTTRLACGPAASRVPAGDEPVVRDPDSVKEGLRRHAPPGAYDLVVAGITAGTGIHIAEAALRHGDHNVLLVPPDPPELRRVLICASVGEPGKGGIRFAGRLARHLGAEVTVLTVIPGWAVGGPLREQADRFLAASARTLASLGVRAATRQRAGNAETEIAAEVRDGQYDLIVVGAPLGVSRGEPSLDGPIASLLQAATRPLLIVRSPGLVS
jgi:sulfate/thiosulfate transport system ATP-binding protein